MNSVVVLNADNTYIGSISWQKSIILLYKGKVEMVKATDRVITNITNTVEFIVPKVVRLIRFIKNVYKKSTVPYSKRAVFIRDNYTCQYCNTEIGRSECTIDHIIPKTKGGKTSWENCVTSCKPCNNLKGDLLLGKDGKLSIADANSVTHVLQLKKKPSKPSVADFLRQRAMRTLLDDIM